MSRLISISSLTSDAAGFEQVRALRLPQGCGVSALRGQGRGSARAPTL